MKKCLVWLFASIFLSLTISSCGAGVNNETPNSNAVAAAMTDTPNVETRAAATIAQQQALTSTVVAAFSFTPTEPPTNTPDEEQTIAAIVAATNTSVAQTAVAVASFTKTPTATSTPNEEQTIAAIVAATNTSVAQTAIAVASFTKTPTATSTPNEEQTIAAIVAATNTSVAQTAIAVASFTKTPTVTPTFTVTPTTTNTPTMTVTPLAAAIVGNLVGNKAAVDFIVFSKDGKRVVSAGEDGTIRLWNIDSGQELAQFKVTQGKASYSGLSLSPDAKLVAVAGSDGVLHVWDVGSAQVLWEAKSATFKSLRAVNFSPNGQQMVTATENGISTWDSASGKEVLQIPLGTGSGNPVASVQYSPDGKSIVVASKAMGFLLDSQTGTELQRIRGVGVPTNASFSISGELVLLGSEGGNMWLYSTTEKKLLTNLPVGEPHTAYFSADNAKAIAHTASGAIEIWDIQARKEIARLVDQSPKISGLAISPISQRIMTANTHGDLYFWDLNLIPAPPQRWGIFVSSGSDVPSGVPNTWRRTSRLDARYELSGTKSNQTIETCPYSGGASVIRQVVAVRISITDLETGQAAGSKTFTGGTPTTCGYMETFYGGSRTKTYVGSDPNAVTIQTWVYDQFEGKQVLAGPFLQSKKLRASSVIPRCARFNAQGDLLVVSVDKEALIYTIDGSNTRTLKGHTKTISCASFSPDGKLVVTAGTDKTVRLWDAAAGTEIRQISTQANSLDAVFSPDGKLIAEVGGTAQKVTLYEVATGNKVLEISLVEKRNGIAAVFSPSGKHLLVVDSQRQVQVFGTASGQQELTLGTNVKANDAAYSADGKLIATAEEGGLVRLWDATNGTLIREIKAHGNRVLAVNFSADGRYLVTGSADNTGWVLEVSTGNQIALLPWHRNAINAASFSPDGRTILTSSSDGSVRTWDTSAVLSK